MWTKLNQTRTAEGSAVKPKLVPLVASPFCSSSAPHPGIPPVPVRSPSRTKKPIRTLTGPTSCIRVGPSPHVRLQRRGHHGVASSMTSWAGCLKPRPDAAALGSESLQPLWKLKRCIHSSLASRTWCRFSALQSFHIISSSQSERCSHSDGVVQLTAGLEAFRGSRMMTSLPDHHFHQTWDWAGGSVSSRTTTMNIRMA